MERLYAACLNHKMIHSCAARSLQRSLCGDYILERVIDRQMKCVRYSGPLNVDGLPAHLCESLSLCSAEVIQAEPVNLNCAAGCMAECPWIRLTMLCTVQDDKGCKRQGIASIEFESFQHCSTDCGTCARFAAQIRLLHACYIGCSTFDVHLDIGLQVVISRAEILCCRQECAKEDCPQLPLYPQVYLPHSRCR